MQHACERLLTESNPVIHVEANDIKSIELHTGVIFTATIDNDYHLY